MGVVIDHHVGIADLGEGIAAPAELGAERRFGAFDAGRIDRVAGVDREGLAQGRRIRPGGGVEAGQGDVAEPVKRPRRRVQRHREAAGRRRIDRGGHQRVIIAVGAQQLGEQIGVGAGAAIDLRGIGGVVMIFLERRKRAEPGEQGRLPGRVQPLDPVAVAPRRGGIGDIGARLVRDRLALILLHVGPGHAEIGPRLHRRGGIERRRLGGWRLNRWRLNRWRLDRWWCGHGRRRRAGGLRARSGRTEDQGKGGRQRRRTPPRNDLQHKTTLAGGAIRRQ